MGRNSHRANWHILNRTGLSIRIYFNRPCTENYNSHINRNTGCIHSIGLLGAYTVIHCFKRLWVPDFLQELVTLVMVISTFIGSNIVQADSGILTVVLMGIILANQQQISLQHVKVFKENLRILSISSLFIVLSSRLVFSDLMSLIDMKHFIYLLSLIFSCSGNCDIYICYWHPIKIQGTTINGLDSSSRNCYGIHCIVICITIGQLGRSKC